MMNMHVVFAHDKPLPVKDYGGTERILYWLMKTLVQKNHKVTLIGHPYSKVEEIGVHLVPGTAQTWPTLIPHDADIVNLFFPWFSGLPVPFVCRVGGNGRPGEKFPVNTVFVSKSHAINHNAEAYVYNGIDPDEYPNSLLAKKDRLVNWERFMFLAKASWKVKNLKDCVSACKKTKKHLEIAGGRTLSLSKYIHSHGMVGQGHKRKLLATCDALLWPIRWEEPFGIAMIEAMAAGMPVISSNHGSSPEIITSKTGVICNNYSEFEKALRAPPQEFRTQEIREYALDNFSVKKMTDAYLKMYEKVLNGERLNKKIPHAKRKQSAQNLAPF